MPISREAFENAEPGTAFVDSDGDRWEITGDPEEIESGIALNVSREGNPGRLVYHDHGEIVDEDGRYISELDDEDAFVDSGGDEGMDDGEDDEDIIDAADTKIF